MQNKAHQRQQDAAAIVPTMSHPVPTRRADPPIHRRIGLGPVPPLAQQGADAAFVDPPKYERVKRDPSERDLARACRLCSAAPAS